MVGKTKALSGGLSSLKSKHTDKKVYKLVFVEHVSLSLPLSLGEQ